MVLMKGAAITAGVGVGAFGFDAVDRFIQITEENKPDLSKAEKYGEMKKLFDEAYYSLAGLFEKL